MRFPKWMAKVGPENIYHYWIKAMNIKNTKIVVACQEDQVSLRAHPAFDYTNKNCRVCDAELTTVRQVINECPHNKNTLYKARHNWVASTIVKHLCKKFEIQFARNGGNDKCKFVYDSPCTISVNLKHHIPCPWFGFMQDQLNIKRVKYTVHSESKVGLDWRSYKKDVNFCDVLSLQERMKVVFLPVIIPPIGQVFKKLKFYLRDTLNHQKCYLFYCPDTAVWDQHGSLNGTLLSPVICRESVLSQQLWMF